MKNITRRLGLAVAVMGIASGTSEAGPVSSLYLTAGDQSRIAVVQGGDVIGTWATPTLNPYPIAVADTVRTSGAGVNGPGAEYTLSGVSTGATYMNHTGQFVFDGTTDGIYNYTVGFSDGWIYRTGQDWSGPVALFKVGNSSSHLGITYDISNNSLWVSQFGGNAIENWSMDGNLLNSFSTGHDRNAALALDSADNSLWIFNQSTLSDPAGVLFEQYSKFGTLLSTQRYTALAGQNVLGGEFQLPPAVSAVPEPSTIALVGTAIPMALVFACRRRKPLVG